MEQYQGSASGIGSGVSFHSLWSALVLIAERGGEGSRGDGFVGIRECGRYASNVAASRSNGIQAKKAELEEIWDQRIGREDSGESGRRDAFKTHFVEETGTRCILEAVHGDPGERNLSPLRSRTEMHGNRRVGQQFVIGTQNLGGERGVQGFGDVC